MNRKLLLLIPISYLVAMALVFGTASSQYSFPSKGQIFQVEKVHNLDTGLNYTTIQEAIDAQETDEGQTIFVDEGIYYEHVFINKSLSLFGEHRETTIIDGSDSGTVVNITASGVVISGFTVQNSGYYPYCGVYVDTWSAENNISYNIIKNNDYGISLDDSSNHNSISGNIVANNYFGINLDSSSHNIIVESNCSSNTVIGINLFGVNNTVRNNDVSFTLAGCGITVNSGYNNTIIDNDINSNCEGGIILTIDSCYNTIANNNISLNYPSYGIYLGEYSNNNTIRENNLVNNPYGVYISYAYNNSFFHNNFINNTQQVYNWENASENIWDDDYPSGGNYWSDYEDKYPDAEEIDGSGIWNTPYEIDENNQDNYPIVPEFPSFLVLPLFMMATLLAVIVYRRKHTL